MTDLQICLVSLDIVWENPESNRKKIEALLDSDLAQSADIIVLPEMFTTGFVTSPESIAESFRGKQSESIVWMAQQAKKHNACVVGSMAMKEGNAYYNRLVWMPPHGQFEVYDKRHLFSFAGEDKHYSAGKERLIVEWKGWKICPLICYDLRFPVWSRNTPQEDGAAYDLLLYVANWPAVRQSAWESLLAARAIENLCYVAGINRIGKDGNGMAYEGGTLAFDFKGEEMMAMKKNQEGLVDLSISRENLVAFRAKFPALADGDGFVLI